MSRRLALWDMDGTLSNDLHRAPLYIQGTWSEYWNRDNVFADALFEQAITKLRELEADGWEIGILTARLDKHNREVTESWLAEKGIHADPIILRPDEWAHLRPPEFKTFVVNYLVETGSWDKIVLYDNDPHVIEAVQAKLGNDVAIHCTWDLERDITND